MANYNMYYMTSKTKYFNKVYINEQKLARVRFQHDGLLITIYIKVPQSPHLYHQNQFFNTDFKFERIYFDEIRASQTDFYIHAAMKEYVSK